ncbi:hypothetical protein D9M72_349350 [compost metagenome]
MLAIGLAVAAVEEAPGLVVDLAAAQVAEADAGLRHLAPLGADVLALLLRQRGQEVVETGVRLTEALAATFAAIGPVELHAVPHQHAGLLHQPGFGLVGEEDMQRRHAAFRRQRQHHLQQQPARLRIFSEQPRAAHWRERDRRQPFGVVLDAMPGIGIGPGPVEHVLAIRMRLGIERHRRGQPVAGPQRQEARMPAGLGACAAAGMQGMQEGVAQEGRGFGLAREQRVPGGRVDLGQVGDDARLVVRVVRLAGFLVVCVAACGRCVAGIRLHGLSLKGWKRECRARRRMAARVYRKRRAGAAARPRVAT